MNAALCAVVCLSMQAKIIKTPICLDESLNSLKVSTRILGRRTAPYPPFLVPYRVPYGFTRDPSTDPKILMPSRLLKRPCGSAAAAFSTSSPVAAAARQ